LPRGKIRYNRLFFLYLIGDQQGATAVTQQLSEFSNEFVGSVWSAKDDRDEESPQVVFMDNSGWTILEASVAELKKRH